LLGKSALSEEEMGSLLLEESSDGDGSAVSDSAEHADEEEEFSGGGPNRLHLYGIIYDVFEGCIDPSLMTKEHSGVQPDLKFGLGVSSFEDDTADIGDAVYFNGRFFVRRTEAGEERFDPSGTLPEHTRRVKEGTADTYRTSYSLGVTQSPQQMAGRRFVFDNACHGKRTMRDMLTEFIGPPRTEVGEPGRILGFQGLIEYEAFLGTSLSVAPSQGENILPVIDDYARKSIPVPKVSGMVMGFVRTAVEEHLDGERAHALYERMFFDNPRDNDGRLGEAGASSDHGEHWISHTHGVILPPGDSIFGGNIVESDREGDEEMQRRLMRLATDEEFRTRHLDECHSRTWHDCGHVIPGSALSRYFFTLFDVHHVDVFNPRL